MKVGLHGCCCRVLSSGRARAVRSCAPEPVSFGMKPCVTHHGNLVGPLGIVDGLSEVPFIFVYFWWGKLCRSRLLLVWGGI